MSKSKTRTGLVVAPVEQLKELCITDVPNGALVELYEIDQYDTPYGPGSRMRYKYKTFDYIIPTKWVV